MRSVDNDPLYEDVERGPFSSPLLRKPLTPFPILSHTRFLYKGKTLISLQWLAENREQYTKQSRSPGAEGARGNRWLHNFCHPGYSSTSNHRYTKSPKCIFFISFRFSKTFEVLRWQALNLPLFCSFSETSLPAARKSSTFLLWYFLNFLEMF